MAITVDQGSLGTASGVGTLNSITVTTGAVVASNGFIVLQTMIFGSTALLNSVSGGGLTWTVDIQDIWGPNSGVRTGYARAYAPSGLASSTVITPTFSSADAGTPYVFGVSSWLGVKTSSPVDVLDGPDHSLSGSGGTGINAWSSNSKSIQAGSLLLACAFDDSSSAGNTPTSPSLQAWDKPDGGGFGGCCCYRIEASAGSYQVAGTFGGPTGIINVIAASYLADVPQPTYGGTQRRGLMRVS